MNSYGALRQSTRGPIDRSENGASQGDIWCWCASHEGFDGKSPVYVRELYPYTTTTPQFKLSTHYVRNARHSSLLSGRRLVW